jgi:hypothetical protein
MYESPNLLDDFHVHMPHSIHPPGIHGLTESWISRWFMKRGSTVLQPAKNGDVYHASPELVEKSCFILPSGKRLHNYGKPLCFMGKLTISMAIFNSFLYVYQRVWFASKIGASPKAFMQQNPKRSTRANLFGDFKALAQYESSLDCYSTHEWNIILTKIYFILTTKYIKWCMTYCSNIIINHHIQMCIILFQTTIYIK